MNKRRSNQIELERIDRQAAEWILRRDRALTASEQDEFCQWLAADRRHGACFARHARNWDRLDQMTEWRPANSMRPNPDLLAMPRKRMRWLLPLTLAAAVVALAVYSWRPHPEGSPAPALPGIEERVLTDGSRVLLNRGAAMRVEYSPAERRVRLERGEAQFDVAKNPSRPFVVDAGAVRVRAVGTAFDVRFGERTVSVLVTEGSVRLDGMARAIGTPATAPGSPAHAVPVLAAGEQAEIPVDSGGPPPEVKTVSHEYIRRILAWQPQLLDFTAAPLSNIIAEFNRHNIVQLMIVGPDLAALRISASFRSDNVDGFVSLLESSFGVRVERRGRGQIVLRSSR